jgi:transmembrane sensor
MELRDKKDIEILLGKYSESELTGTENAKLYDLLITPENEEFILQILASKLREYDDNKDDIGIIDFDHIYKNITLNLKQLAKSESENRKVKRRDQIKRILIQSSAMAAIFVLAFFLGNKLSVINPIKPNVTEKIISNSEIRTPLGAKSEVTLSDGTQVMLNAGSVLKYGNDFNSDNRNLTLEGEAYFKVAKNIDLPFIVNAGNISIKAVGTEFNVKAYMDEGIIETTLIKGSVEIIKNGKDNNGDNLLDLKQNQKAIYIKESNLLTLKLIKEIDPSVVMTHEAIDNKILIAPTVDVNQIVAWTKNELIIKSERLEDISIELQRKYDIRIIFGDNSIKSYRFTGILEDEPIEQVLDAIKLTAPINYVITGKTVLMLLNKDQTTNFSKDRN